MLAIVAIASVVMFSGCVEEETPVKVPETIQPEETPTPIEPSMTLEEIYREFYYDILGWGNVYDSSTLQRYIEQKDEEKLRAALKDFDTIIENFINNVKENGYESRVDEEFIDWDDLLEVHASLRWVDRLDIYQLCDVVEDMPGFVSDLKEELIEFIS